jgi:hypothetical protein
MFMISGAGVLVVVLFLVGQFVWKRDEGHKKAK